jgi:polysaccharide pyruvyl transferase WcaK-like protein
MKLILAGNGYGAGNIGDEAILAGIIDMLKNRLPSIEIEVVSDNPRFTEAMHGVRSFGWVHLVHPKRILKYLIQVRNADFVIFGGGTLGDDTYGLMYPILTISQMIILTKLLGVSYGMLAIGVNRFRTKIGANIVRLLYGSMKFITVRDSESKEVCKEIGIMSNKLFECADAAYAMKPFNIEQGKLVLIQRGINPKEKMVAVNVLTEIYEQFDYKKKIAKLCDYLIEKYEITPVFISHEIRPGMDQTANCETIEFMEHKDRVRILSTEFYNPRLMVAILSNFIFTLGMRMHILILSAMASVPVIGISRVDKVNNFFNQLNLDTVTSIQDFNLDKMFKSIDDIIYNREWYVNQVAAFSQERYEKAILNANILIKNINAK